MLALPFMFTVIVPFLIYNYSSRVLPAFQNIPTGLTTFLGVLCFLIGICLFVKSVELFIKIGNGTLAPWSPTQKMVVKGLYQYVRNPMLTGVNLILLSEAFYFRSGKILLYVLLFLLLNHAYFVFKEEPDLLKRFGKEYQEYCKNVPRWIPRLSPWRPKN